ncbi:MAG: glycosyltransferase family 4 protein [Candidatus Gottesmanbacteria bacterium]|nr:glycosyltransferase family 4 protein [Candidatus Gottesmanbacteria bacterium]
MNIGFYSPYLDTLGGGERYVFTLASHWSKMHSVSVFWNQSDILRNAQKRFNIDLSRIKVARNIFGDTSVLKKLVLTRQYDLIFFLSDGSIPSTLAKYNILHYQSPFGNISYSPIKLTRYQVVVCNSQFTKDALDRRIRGDACVIYPPVSPVPTSRTKKENIILSVGRFTGIHTAKKQHVLIESFTEGIKIKKWNGWKLVFAGGMMPGEEGYLNHLKDISRGLPIIFEPNISFNKLTDYYLRARIYWHAAGFGESDPRFMEHFGISTVEAMSVGVIPVVFHGGGQSEIVDHGTNGFLWTSRSDLIAKTTLLMTDNTLAETMQKNTVAKSKEFSVSRFCDSFDAILSKITL